MLPIFRARSCLLPWCEPSLEPSQLTACLSAAGIARGTAAGVVGWVLRHRRMLVIAYAIALHCLVYYLLLSRGSCAQVRFVCSTHREEGCAR